MIHAVSREIAGKAIGFETGRLAKQANGAVLIGVGDTIALVTATMAAEPREGQDWFPLTCDYEERFHQARGQAQREGRPDFAPHR
jgi:polyribonucleotide nucleotidyltransferase